MQSKSNDIKTGRLDPYQPLIYMHPETQKHITFSRQTKEIMSELS